MATQNDPQKSSTRTFNDPWPRPASTIFPPTLCEFMPFSCFGWQSFVHRARCLPVSGLSERDHVIGRDDLPRNSLKSMSRRPFGASQSACWPSTCSSVCRLHELFFECKIMAEARNANHVDPLTPGENPFDACGPSRCFGHNFTPSCPCPLPNAWLCIGFGAILVAGGLTTRCSAVRPTSISCPWRTLGRKEGRQR